MCGYVFGGVWMCVQERGGEITCGYVFWVGGGGWGVGGGRSHV